VNQLQLKVATLAPQGLPYIEANVAVIIIGDRLEKIRDGRGRAKTLLRRLLCQFTDISKLNAPAELAFAPSIDVHSVTHKTNAARGRNKPARS
jgi:hypothetical protein